MNKQIKSAAYTLMFLLIYYWASKGIVKLLANTTNQRIFDARVQLINYSIVIFSLFYIVGIYHIVGPYHTESFYKYFIIFNFIYLAVGNLFNSLITNNFKN
jgi:hypothetical protein